MNSYFLFSSNSIRNSKKQGLFSFISSDIFGLTFSLCFFYLCRSSFSMLCTPFYFFLYGKCHCENFRIEIDLGIINVIVDSLISFLFCINLNIRNVDKHWQSNSTNYTYCAGVNLLEYNENGNLQYSN